MIDASGYDEKKLEELIAMFESDAGREAWERRTAARRAHREKAYRFFHGEQVAPKDSDE